MAEESAAGLVEYACKDQVATLTLNRPQRLNAFSDELVRHLADALRRFDLDPEAQVAVICGNGRAFSSGAMCTSVSCASGRSSWSMAGRRAGAPIPATS
jgi:enoyl-CoA hydratase/carnithine racemase